MTGGTVPLDVTQAVPPCEVHLVFPVESVDCVNHPVRGCNPIRASPGRIPPKVCCCERLWSLMDMKGKGTVAESYRAVGREWYHGCPELVPIGRVDGENLKVLGEH